jgi:hypothetical protein
MSTFADVGKLFFKKKNEKREKQGQKGEKGQL